MLAALRNRTRGQSGSEYMLVISVVTLAIVGAAYAFVPSFREGTEVLGADVRDILGTGQGTRLNAAGTAPGGEPVSADTDDGGGLGDVPGQEGPATGGGPATGPGQNGGAPAGGDNTRHERTRRSCIFVICWETRETAISSGTGGEGTVAEAQKIEEGSDGRIDGSWKSFFQGDIAQLASQAGEDIRENPLCAVAIVAAMTGRTVDQAYKELEQNNRLATVKRETTVLGITSTSYVTTGVMEESQLAAALRNDYGLRVQETPKPRIADVQKALAQGQKPIIFYDDGDGSGRNGHFGVVTDYSDVLGVKVDSATGSYWIPPAELQRRMDVMNGRMISVEPGRGRAVAQGP